MVQIFFILFLMIAPPAKGAIISKAVGQVKEIIVTSREVQMNEMVENALYNRAIPSIKIKAEKVTSKRFSNKVGAVLLEWVVFLEAKNFAAGQIKSSEVRKATGTVLRRLGRNTHWRSLEVLQSELDQVIRRKIAAKKFIRFKADSSVVPVTNDEAKAYYDQNQKKFGELPFAEFKADIVSYLTRKKVDKRLKDWFEVLQAKYKVRNFLAEL